MLIPDLDIAACLTCKKVFYHDPKSTNFCEECSQEAYKNQRDLIEKQLKEIGYDL